VIRRVFRVYVDQAPVLMPAAAVVFVITGIVTELLVEKGSEGLVFLAEVIALVASTLFTGMVVELVADVQDGRRDSSPRQLLHAVMPVLGQLIGVAIVTSVCEAVGFVLVIVPGLFLMTIWAVVAPVVVIERPGGLGALARSRDLVRGNGWQVFGVILLLVIGVAIVVGAIDAVSVEAGTAVAIVVRVVIGVLSAPIPALAAAMLYFELRSRPGGAGVSGYPSERPRGF
jgi:hypothetical protein